MYSLTTWRFGDLGELYDGPHATPRRVAEGPYFLNIASLKSGRLDLSESDHVGDEDFRKWTRRVTPRENDLLFSYETRLGEAALMPPTVEACLGRRMALFRPRTQIVNPRFLLYHYLSPRFQQTIATHTVHGATVPRIGLATMPDWTLELPDFKTQRDIAEVLGALDDKIAANDRAVEKVTELSAALFARAMATTTRGKVTTISSLSAAGKVTFGDGYRTKKSELSASGFSIIRAADVQGGVVRLHGQDFVSTDFERQIGAKAARAGDVVVTTKGTVGRVAVVPELSTPAVYSPQCCYFRLADSSALSWGFLVGWLMSRSFTQQLESVMHKSDMAPYVNLGDVGSLTLRVPDQAVQRRIDVEQRTLLDHAEQLAAETAALTRARDELLPLLMSGKLTVKDADDRASDVLSQ